MSRPRPGAEPAPRREAPALRLIIALVLAAVVLSGWIWLSGALEVPGGPLERDCRWPAWNRLTIMRSYPRPGPASAWEGPARRSELACCGLALRHEIVAAADARRERTIVYVHTWIERR